jgi:hypothetical protein
VVVKPFDTRFTCRWVPLQGACVAIEMEEDRCDSPATEEEYPVCPGQRFAREWEDMPTWTGNEWAGHSGDYYHAVVVCEDDPCLGATCTEGHVLDPTCCVETVDGTPCTAVFRDEDATKVTCEGGVTPCEHDFGCPVGSWCRATEQVALASHGLGLVRRQCVTYATDGDACGGLTMPWFYEKCMPGSECALTPGMPDLPGVCQSSAGDPDCDDWYYATCTLDADCRTGFRCGVALDGCVPPSCDCHGTCSGDCETLVGLCEAVLCEPGQQSAACTAQCPDIVNRVCGEDGATYANECLADCACVEIAADGACDDGLGRRLLN